MRSSTFSSLALLAASLLVKDVSGRYDVRKRGLVIEDVLVTEQVEVIQQADGSFVTGTVLAVATAVTDSTQTAVSSTVVPTSPSEAIPVKAAAFAADLSPSPSAATTTPPAATTSPPPPATTTSAVAATTSSAAPLATPDAKRGLAYNDITLLEGFLGTGSQAAWCYNWGSSPSGAVPTGLDYVPMLWGLDSGATDGWDAAVSTALSSGSTHLLSFNEPDLSTQSNISPAAAASGYMQYMQGYAGAAQLGSPAVTNGDASAGMGLGWLSTFVSDCEAQGCQIDFVPIHWYNDASETQDFMDHVTQAYAAGGNRPIWITEIGATGSDADQQTFLETVIPWLDSQDFVQRYAYFMVSDGSLISSGSTLSALGNTYAYSAS